MTATSHWRRAADDVIRRVLSALPPTSTIAERRKALQAAYPFGERAHHPYRVWCRAVCDWLGAPRRKNPHPQVRVTPAGVYCDWCSGRRCLACADLCDRFAGWAGDRGEWESLHAAAVLAGGHDASHLVYADWLEEYGWPEEAALTRAEGVAHAR